MDLAPRAVLTHPMAHQHTAHQRSHLDERCARHQFEAAVDRCRQCGHAFCGECLVYSFGERQPPFCIPCALAAAGVRSNAARPPALPKKELKRRQKEAERVRQMTAQADAQTATSAIDWSLPVNGTDPNHDPNYPRFDDEPSSPPVAPSPPPGASRRTGLFGRRKNKVVPF